jgi:hypothetical protein
MAAVTNSRVHAFDLDLFRDGAALCGDFTNPLSVSSYWSGPTCDGVVTGIQIKARAGDIAA